MIAPLPIIAANPVGLIILGAGGYFVYKAGKKTGFKEEETIGEPNFSDRAIKCGMKLFYKAKKSAGETFSKTGEKYSSMWKEARDEAKPE